MPAKPPLSSRRDSSIKIDVKSLLSAFPPPMKTPLSSTTPGPEPNTAGPVPTPTNERSPSPAPSPSPPPPPTTTARPPPLKAAELKSPPARSAKPTPKAAAATAATAAPITENAEWRELKTATGVPYYHNKITGELSATRPDSFKPKSGSGSGSGAMAAADEKSGEWVWVPHPDLAFIPAVKTGKGTSVDKVRVKTQDNQSKEVLIKNTVPLAYASLFEIESDLVVCGDMSQPIVLHILRERLKQKFIYTNIGIVASPFSVVLNVVLIALARVLRVALPVQAIF
jgi:hypothetical protein